MERLGPVSEVVDFRSMAVGAPAGEPPRRALTQVKAVDGLYPLTGAVTLDPPMPLADALAGALEGERLVPTPLNTRRDSTTAPLDPRWRVLVNDEVEPDL